MDQPKLKIALILEGNKIDRWQSEMISILTSSYYAEVKWLIRLNRNKSNTKTNHPFYKKSFWYQSFLKLDQKIFKVKPNAFDQINFNSIKLHEEIKISSTETFLSEESKKRLNKLIDKEVDVILDLSKTKPELNSLNLSKYGVWHLTFSDYTPKNPNLSGLHEVLLKKDFINSRLIVDFENHSKTLINSKSFVDLSSIHKSRNSVFWKTCLFIPRQIENLYKDRQNFVSNLNDLEPESLLNELEDIPYLFSLFKHIFLTVKNIVRNQIFKHFRFNQWILLFKFSENYQTQNYSQEYSRITPPKDRIWADPFIYYKNEKCFIFIEEMLINQNKGFISVMEIYSDGTYSKPVSIIENDYHMSYPFLFEDNDQLYMIPETGSNKTIELYKCVDFPYKWEFKKVLLEGEKAVDTTLFKHNEKYWIFTNKKEMVGASAHEELFLYYTDDVIDKKWIAHPKNPIVSDVSCARSAGNIFVKDNKIYRPAQNCIIRYGYGLKIQEITVLNENEYEEKNIDSIYPNWSNDLLGTHTINHTDGLTIIDALIQRSKF
ncbi:hypothetical protein SAMN04488009_3087 [Maribacter sedimenticola]|uniref:Glucosamine inositolphosphorylceramide transferase 1 N-terminal domain-containing protein n=1 Tax=Maribacter sedimenticola TaxID=228956 RepID=A0ABY1SKC1_9FLAO|nr:hypothetical protein [Maribacter sedimenticola]SNR67068.1 hypothetical protein SAMN04488009_3087 [Maribacter sedimenticola]